MRIGVEVEACFKNGMLALTRSPEYGDLTYMTIDGKPAKYWMLKTDSSLSDRPNDNYYQSACNTNGVTFEFINRPMNLISGLVKTRRQPTDTFLTKLKEDAYAQIKEESGQDSMSHYLSHYYQRNDYVKLDSDGGKYYEIITGQAYKAINFADKPHNQNLEPLYYSELLPALKELYELIETPEDGKFRANMYMNRSCGMHLRVGEPYQLERDKSYAFNPRPLFRLKYRMLKWIAKNESPLDAWLFLTYYRRGTYSGKLNYANTIFTPMGERQEFGYNKGLEWRAFHCVGVKSYSQMVKRIEKGIDLLSDCYRQTLINNIYYNIGDIKPMKYKFQMAMEDVPLTEEELYV